MAKYANARRHVARVIDWIGSGVCDSMRTGPGAMASLSTASVLGDLRGRTVLWDHLTSKGELTFSPQQVIVWNDVQKREVAELHHVDPDRVVVTGSQVFDDWLNRRSSTMRDESCAQVGLRPDRPILLYVYSALIEGSPPEAGFVLRWARHLRGSVHPALKGCGILVRSHFKRGEEWRGIDWSGLDNIVYWPTAGDVPVDACSKSDYFDSRTRRRPVRRLKDERRRRKDEILAERRRKRRAEREIRQAQDAP